MSASKKKKERQANIPETEMTERELRRQEEAKADRRTMMIYTVTGILVAVLAVAAVVFNSGLIQRGSTAITVNGTQYNPAEVQYYYNTTVSNSFGIAPGTTDLTTITMDESTGQTAYDFAMDMTKETLVTSAALADQAKAEGFTLSQESKEYLEQYAEEMKSSWLAMGYSSQDAFLRANFGPYMTMDTLLALVERDTLVSEYLNAKLEEQTFDDAQYEAYYEENADDLDSYTYTSYLLQAKVETTDAEGSTIEMTDEEKAAALAKASEELKPKAEALLAALEAGEDAEALAEEYSDSLLSYQISLVQAGSAIGSTYSEWLMDPARKAGDLTLEEYESETVHNYYVVRFEGRQRDDAPTSDVRHILLAEKEAAEVLLSMWEAGDRSEESFAALAAANSTDTGSAANGGLIPGVAPSSAYVESFRDWAVDPARQAGDAGLVESEYGWHIMYYVGSNLPGWQLTAQSAMLNDAYTAMVDAACEGYEAVEGSGMKYVTP